MRLTLKTLTAAAATLAFLGGATGYAVATTTTPAQLTACADQQGRMRVLQSDTCERGDTTLTWNTQGPEGAPGVQGVAGPQGVPGTQGLPGVTSVRTAAASERTLQGGEFVTIVYGCPMGRWAVAADLILSSPDLRVLRDEPTNAPRARQVDIVNTSASPAVVSAVLTCADVAPGVLQDSTDRAGVQMYKGGQPVGQHDPASTSAP